MLVRDGLFVNVNFHDYRFKLNFAFLYFKKMNRGEVQISFFELKLALLSKNVIFFLHVSYYDTARLALVAGLETHIEAVFGKRFLL